MCRYKQGLEGDRSRLGCDILLSGLRQPWQWQDRQLSACCASLGPASGPCTMLDFRIGQHFGDYMVEAWEVRESLPQHSKKSLWSLFAHLSRQGVNSSLAAPFPVDSSAIRKVLMTNPGRATGRYLPFCPHPHLLNSALGFHQSLCLKLSSTVQPEPLLGPRDT